MAVKTKEVTVQCGVRLLPKEREQLTRAANLLGRTLSSHIRFLLFPPKGAQKRTAKTAALAMAAK